MGFLSVLLKHQRAAGVEHAFSEAVSALDPVAHAGQSGPLWFAVDQFSSVSEVHPRLRVGLGSAGEQIRQGNDFEGWINGLEGSFGALQYDSSAGTLVCARDRFGAVPLYVADTPGVIAVSTRLACLLPFLDTNEVDVAALAESLRFRWLSGQRTLFRGASQLQPGETLRFSAAGVTHVLDDNAPLHFRGDGPAEVESQKHLLRQSLQVAIASILDRAAKPAVLLSGGVDSSVIAALSAELSGNVRYFALRFPGDGVEELRRARFAAQKLGLQLDEVEFDPSRVARDLPRLIDQLEEPPRNPNNLALMQFYEAMQQEGVDVALNGDAAEMVLGLADTTRVAQFALKARLGAPIPRWGRHLLGLALRNTGRGFATRLARILDTSPTEFALDLDEISYAPERLNRLRAWVNSATEDRGTPRAPLFKEAESADGFSDALHRYQCVTTLMSSQRRHECLARGYGIEAVTPFTDSRVLGFAEQLPRALRYTTRSRPVLKALCDELVHPDIARWPKLGFSVPWSTWLDGPLKSISDEASRSAALRHILPSNLLSCGAAGSDHEWRWTVLTLHILLTQWGARAKEG